MPDPVTARARKWCLYPGVHGNPSTGCACGEIEGAVREALEEAKQIADRIYTREHDATPEYRLDGFQVAWEISDAIAALREGRDVPKA